MSETILVTGAAGQLGQRVIHHLIETYKVAPGNIVAATRSPEKLADLEKQGVVTRKADFDDAASLEKAFAGVDRLLIISTDALDTPGKRLIQHTAAVDAAVKGRRQAYRLYLDAGAGQFARHLRARSSRQRKRHQGKRHRLHDHPRRLVSRQLSARHAAQPAGRQMVHVRRRRQDLDHLA